MSEYLVAEPFSVISNHYLEALIVRLFYSEAKEGEKLRIEENKAVKKGIVLKNFKKLVPPFEIMEQTKEE